MRKRESSSARRKFGFKDDKLDYSILEDRRVDTKRAYRSEKNVSFETSRRYNGNHPGKPAEYFSSKGRGVSGKTRRYN